MSARDYKKLQETRDEGKQKKDSQDRIYTACNTCLLNVTAILPHINHLCLVSFHLCPSLFTAVSVSLKDLFESNSGSESISVLPSYSTKERILLLAKITFLSLVFPTKKTNHMAMCVICRRRQQSKRYESGWNGSLMAAKLHIQIPEKEWVDNRYNSPEFHIRWHRYW